MATSKNFIQRFLSSEKQFPVLAALAAGLYPIFFYYTNNYALVKSWQHLGYFVLVFVVAPIFIFFIAHRISKLSFFHKIEKYVLPFMGVFAFLFFLKVCLYAGLQKKMIVGIIGIAGLFAFFLHKHYKKIIVLQLLLALIGLFTLVPTVIRQLNYSKEWLQQPDDIASAIFTKKPNIYFIQPDGYVNPSELNRGYYNYNNSAFDNFLKEQQFKVYPDFRSNYASTLTSNSATFMMKHHYYNKGANFSEAIDAREVIVGNNTVLDNFNRNGYQTNFITEHPYLLLSRPELAFDYCNFSYKDVNYIGTGLGESRDVVAALSERLDQSTEEPSFFFIEFFNPGHIRADAARSNGVDAERKAWIESLEQSNETLRQLITTIEAKDPEALIMILADHGGFVGMYNTGQIYEKTEDRDIIYSIFSSILAIKWPGEAPAYDDKMKSSVNVFRILTSYLTGDTKYLDHLQPDESFVIINKEAPKGIYKYIDDEGNSTFEKH